MAEVNKDFLKIGVDIKKCKDCDKVEVVRCKDCLYWENGKDYEPYCNHFGNMMTDTKADDFCSYGTPKERGGDK
jgi:hypothetical protein